MRVCRGDWVIKGVNGEFYPCKNMRKWSNEVEMVEFKFDDKIIAKFSISRLSAVGLLSRSSRIQIYEGD